MRPYDFQTAPEGQACENCRWFLDYRATEGDDWANGYCREPRHFDRVESEHHEYGGHWTNHAAWCGWWAAKSEQATEAPQAVDAVDPHASSTGKTPTRAKV